LPTLQEVRAALARRSLLRFTEYTNPLYTRAAHHELIAEKLEAVESGEIDRLMIFMPPRHGKSELASKRFPAWCLGRNPRRQIIAASYNSDLANDFGRNVRNLVAEPEFGQVFPNVSLAPDSQAANRMNTNHKGTYVAAGVGTAVTGRGADIALIDDPLKDREEADSERRRDLVWDWYRSTLYTRLMPGGKVVLIQCMTGDTPVLMHDGTERPLRDIRVGDLIATYENGRITTSTVRNWANQGADNVFVIRMKSGRTVRANARHPFLAYENGEEVWRRTDTLRKGSVILTAIGVNGGEQRALPMDAASLQSAKACACRTTTSSVGVMVSDRLRSTLGLAAKRICGIATELISPITSGCWQSKAVSAPSVANHRLAGTRERIGTGSCASITAMMAGTFEGCCATTAISRSDTGKLKQSYEQPLTTFEIAHDEVVEVVECGVEDVYDIQVDRTENFIANGLVSHNTRWHEDDLAGRLLEQDGRKETGGQWEVLELPAIGKNYTALWPEWYPVETLERIKSTIGPREWSALYQQKPQPDEGTFFKREWFKTWDKLPSLRFYGSSDYAVTDGGGDYTVHTVWGIDGNGDVYRVDQWKGQTASDEWIERKLDLIKKHKPLAWFGEGGVIQKAVEPMLKRRMRERNIHCRLEWLSSVADKPTRARSFQAMAATQRVHFEAGADLSEFLVFPAGKHDDEVDTASLIGRAIDQAHPAIVSTQAKKKPRDRWDRAFKDEEGSSSWRVA
jgi:predicted phage terminase large subunit-like protein